MLSVSLAVTNARILSMTKGPLILKNATLCVEDDRITEIGENISVPRGTDRIDGSGKIVLPGLINTHSHAAMTLLRGYADDLKLDEWLNKWIWPLEAKMTPEDISIGAKLAAVEAALSGSTLLTSMYWHIVAEGKAIAEVGIRGMLGPPCVSWRHEESLTEAREAAKELHDKYDGLLRVAMMPHAPYTVAPDLLKKMRNLTNELNKRYGSMKSPIIMHTHVSETQDDWQNTLNQGEKWEKEGIDTTPITESSSVVEYLNRLEMFEDNNTGRRDFLAAHCVWLSQKDIQIMRDNEVKIAHNPESNLKLGSGIAPLPKSEKAGLTIGLGTDSSCSNNTLDMFRTMKLTALLHKGNNLDPTLFPAYRVLQFATVQGAKALHWDDIGTLAIGKKADFITVDLRKPHLTPLHNEISHLVYAACGSDISETVVNGQLIVNNSEIQTVDVPNLIEEAERTKTKLIQKIKDSELPFS